MTSKTVLWRIETNETDTGEWEPVVEGDGMGVLVHCFLAKYEAEGLHNERIN